ncbi:DUF1643 domain-containing protein [Acidithiobacillus ferriphilus]|uniref:DUF1643 domain-containing protein n=1 Tax=Acidithiobacillus ferriphilus TaxID=1689834 RepID=UPI002DB75DAF|nr:DUF1643 domain-containing protein [Acidithiobacillus ferriphilus]MEB8474268.1 DUF1643 domain-containing protein [Acidithiobacillus ferriphilus]
MRIGRTIQHAPAVDASKITALFSTCRTWRYRLTLPFLNRDGALVTVFLKNPSSASETAADKTVRTASEFVWRRFPDAGGVHILNLYAIRGTDSAEVGRMLTERGEAYVIGPENDETIAQTLANSKNAIIAWGGHAGVPAAPYDERIRQCRHVLEKSRTHIFRNGRKGSEKYPFHACYWGYEDELTAVSIPF